MHVNFTIDSNMTDDDGVLLPENFERMRNTPEDIQLMLDLGFDVDDDSAPAPENVPNDVLSLVLENKHL